MSEGNDKSLMPRPRDPGFFRGLNKQFRLILRLMRDGRVNPLFKLLPLASLIYLLVPDIVIGPIDDAAVLGLGLYTFVELCPDEVVAEHRAALEAQVGGSAENE